MENNYFFIDGSCLLKDIERYNKKNRFSKKLNLEWFIKYFHKNFSELHSWEYKRICLYFVEWELRVNKLINCPLKNKPHSLDFEIIYCWEKIKWSKKIDGWLNKKNAPDYVLERLNKTEKWVDVQICCDWLFLAWLWKLDRLFLYTNDSDYIPFCKTIKYFWCNISLFKISDDKLNKDLAEVVDTFSTINNSLIEQYNIFS